MATLPQRRLFMTSWNNFNDPDREVDLTYTLEIIDDEDGGAVDFYELHRIPRWGECSEDD